jgi:ubiquinone/menaquinone biosynthesis C-methylase UbiE
MHGRVIGVNLAEHLLALAKAKAETQKLANIQFREADMTALGYADESFDAVVCVFAIFFVPDMVRQVQELWRMVRPGGQIAITTWGPRMFEPGSAAWWAAVKQFRPDLYNAFNPWERIITVEAVRQLLTESGIENAEVIAEDGQQALQTPDDWWTVVCGSGYRWTVDQMDQETATRVREVNLTALRQSKTKFIETNVIFALAGKR